MLPQSRFTLRRMLTATLLLAAAFQLPPQSSDAVIGVSAIHLESGRRIGVRGTERFPMGSVYKFPIVLAALQRVDAGTLKLDQEITIEPKDFSPGWSPLRDEREGEADHAHGARAVALHRLDQRQHGLRQHTASSRRTGGRFEAA